MPMANKLALLSSVDPSEGLDEEGAARDGFRDGESFAHRAITR
jgi:hypothetical protein